MRKLKNGFILLLVFILIFMLACGDASILVQNEEISFIESTDPFVLEPSEKPGYNEEQTKTSENTEESESFSETAEVKSETVSTIAESVESKAEPGTATADDTVYLYTAKRMHYDVRSAADILLGEECTAEIFTDDFVGVDYSLYENTEGTLVSLNDLTFFYNMYRVSECYSEVIEIGRPGMYVQDAILKNKFPYSAKDQEHYDEAKAICDELAKSIGFPYDQTSDYYIDYEYLQKYMIHTGPSYYHEQMSQGRAPDMNDSIDGWSPEETAFLFIYSKKSIDEKELCSVTYENELVVIYAPLYGICYVNCPSSQDYLSKKEISVISKNEAYQAFLVESARHGLSRDEIEVISMDVVYSAYMEDGIPEDEVKLYPYWKVTYECLLSDKEVEERICKRSTFRMDSSSEWFMLIEAYIGDE